jgi:hypothetical protein
MLIEYARYIPGVVGILARLTKVALIVWERLFDARSHRRASTAHPKHHEICIQL